MIRIDYERNWKAKRMKFRDEIRCMADLYLQQIGKFQTQETKKIIVNCVESDNDEVGNLDGFTEVEAEFDYEHYAACCKDEKKKIIVETLHNGLLKAGKFYKWDLTILMQAYRSVVEKKHKNEYVWKQKSSPSRAYRAEVFCRHDLDTYTITINVLDRKTEEWVKSEKLISEIPNEFAFAQHLGSLKWLSNTEVCLVNQNKTKQWIVSVR
ncbi:hypothetical protein ACFQPF_01445 [Fictibacillus iocasae]|uniref:Uncharacterized protein n=1 Tax=Fictibacillus iocasae TaxID=2715437 RepID=A0ABW2NMA3_9BACL